MVAKGNEKANAAAAEPIHSTWIAPPIHTASAAGFSKQFLPLR